jgi:hypothetical protein
MRTLPIDELRGQVRGDVISSEDERYEDARTVYNAMIDRRPAVIVRAANAGDVMAGVNFARERQPVPPQPEHRAEGPLASRPSATRPARPNAPRAPCRAASRSEA